MPVVAAAEGQGRETMGVSGNGAGGRLWGCHQVVLKKNPKCTNKLICSLFGKIHNFKVFGTFWWFVPTSNTSLLVILYQIQAFVLWLKTPYGKYPLSWLMALYKVYILLIIMENGSIYSLSKLKTINNNKYNTVLYFSISKIGDKSRIS